MELTKASELAIAEMEKHGLYSSGWRFNFDNAKRRFGRCSYRLRMITLSRVLVQLNDEAQILDTILHEIAHAIAGPTAGHGPLWQAHAAALGTRPERCVQSSTVKVPRGKYVAACPTCRHEFHRYRVTRSTLIFHCGTCSRRYGMSDNTLLTYVFNSGGLQ